MKQEIKKLEQIYEGKAKILFKTNEENILIQYFKDDTTAFNKKKFEIIEGKGELNNEISSIIMTSLKNIVPNHFIRKLNSREQIVKSVKVIPLEVIVRNVAAGSFAKNFGIENGIPLKAPSFELFLKNDELNDPMISPSQAIVLDIATKEEIEKIEGYALQINSFLKDFFEKIEIKLVDFKIEFGYTEAKELILADEISPDSCRLWDMKTGKILDKDIFRKDLGSLIEGYTEILNRIRAYYK